MRETLALSGLNLLRPNMFYPPPVKPWMVRAEKQERTKTVLKKKVKEKHRLVSAMVYVLCFFLI